MSSKDEEFEKAYAAELARAKEEMSRDPKLKKLKKKYLEELRGKVDFLENANFTGLDLLTSGKGTVVTTEDFVRRGRKLNKPLEETPNEARTRIKGEEK